MCIDPRMRDLMARRVEFVSQEIDASEDEYDDIGELLNFILVEPGDTLQDIDAEMDGTFLDGPLRREALRGRRLRALLRVTGGARHVLQHGVQPSAQSQGRVNFYGSSTDRV